MSDEETVVTTESDQKLDIPALGTRGEGSTEGPVPRLDPDILHLDDAADDGPLTMALSSEVIAGLFRQRLTTLPGIGAKLEMRLIDIGVETVGSFLRRDIEVPEDLLAVHRLAEDGVKAVWRHLTELLECSQAVLAEGIIKYGAQEKERAKIKGSELAYVQGHLDHLWERLEALEERFDAQKRIQNRGWAISILVDFVLAGLLVWIIVML
jgi:hypothetical protein